MGSNTRRKAHRWLGDVIAHAVILKDGNLSARTICGLDAKSMRAADKRAERCHGCTFSIDHNVLTEWIKP